MTVNSAQDVDGLTEFSIVFSTALTIKLPPGRSSAVFFFATDHAAKQSPKTDNRKLHRLPTQKHMHKTPIIAMG